MVEYPALVPISTTAPAGAVAARIARNRPVSDGIWRSRSRWGVPSIRSRASIRSSSSMRAVIEGGMEWNMGLLADRRLDPMRPAVPESG